MGGIAGSGPAVLSDEAPADMTLDDIIDQVSGWFPPDADSLLDFRLSG